jgi:hypothetical protein
MVYPPATSEGDTAASFLHGVKIVQTQYINFRGLFCYVMNLYDFKLFCCHARPELLDSS